MANEQGHKTKDKKSRAKRQKPRGKGQEAKNKMQWTVGKGKGAVNQNFKYNLNTYKNCSNFRERVVLGQVLLS